MKIYGNGTVAEVVKGKEYRIRLNVGKISGTNNYRKSPWKTIFCTQKEVRDEITVYKQELIAAEEASHHPPKIEIPTIREYSNEFQLIRRNTKKLSPNTLRHDEIDINYTNNLFGEIRMDELTASYINKRCASFRASENVSLNVINRIAKMLKRLYRRAVIEGIIEYRQNPCFGIDIDKPEPASRRSLTIEEFKRLEQIVNADKMEAHIVAVKLGIATGMRKGEILGLQWKQVDFDSKRILVEQQLTQDMCFKPPKSRAGNRRLFIDDDTIEYLRRWKVEQEQQLMKMHVKQTLATLVVCRDDGSFFDPRLYSRWFRDFSVKHGFGTYVNTEDYKDNQGDYDGWHRKHKSGYHGLCFHELRHTQATLLIGNGVDIKTVQHRLGHADIQTTLNIYAHNIDANDEAAAAAIAAMKA